jgi:hypothetical protein
MSIDAVIDRVERNADGTADILLVAADPRRAPAGQTRMTVLNPPPQFEAAVGTQIWGGANSVMVGQTHWADRIGYTRLRLATDRWQYFGKYVSGESVYRCSQCGRHSTTTDATCPTGCRG